MRTIKNYTSILFYSLLSFFSAFATDLAALPEVNNVAAGNATIKTDTNSVQVNQGSDKAVINWNNFNVNPNEKVHFQQNPNAICLNRVDHNNGMSLINGSLTSTGKIFIINPAGVLFGEHAKVNVGGIITSTSDISDQNFLSSKNKDGITQYKFDQPGAAGGAIINKGEIKVAEGGILAFLGSAVKNDGVIQSKVSEIHLASGSKFTVDFFGSELIEFAIDAPAVTRGVDEKGRPLSNGVDMLGKIVNDGGAVYLTADAVQGVFDNVINMAGVIRANSVYARDGKIVLAGSEKGTVKVTGELDASSKHNNEYGTPVIIVQGEKIALDGKATLNVSNSNGDGGLVIVGITETMMGDSDVKIPPTQEVYVGSEVTINADAKNSGNGGAIFIGAKNTEITGKISATGGTKKGDGGIVVFSGTDSKNITPSAVDVSAKNGQHGKVVFIKESD